MNDKANKWEKSNIKNVTRLGRWAGLWLVTSAIASFGPKFLWEFDTLLTIAAVIANLSVGFGLIFVVVRQLKGFDELQRMIFLQAAALTLGIGIVCGVSYEILEDIGLISLEPEISHLIILMGLTFMGGILFGHWRYR